MKRNEKVTESETYQKDPDILKNYKTTFGNCFFKFYVQNSTLQ